MQRPVRLSNIYFEWKKYMDGRDRKQEMVEMLDYARYYQQVTEAQNGNKQIVGKNAPYLQILKSDVTNVFFIQSLK